MALKPVLDSIDDLPDPLKEHYVKGEDGKFALAVTGMVAKAKVDEFREKNIALIKDLDALKASVDGVNPEEYRLLKEKEADIEKKLGELKTALADKPDIEKIVNERTAKMRETFQGEVKKATETAQQYQARLARELIDRSLATAAIAAGCVETAVDDIVMRGRQTFVLSEDGEHAVPKRDGKTIFGDDGEPLTMKGWLESLAQSAPHLFKQSQGGGASNGGRPTGSGTVRSKADLRTTSEKSKFIAEHGYDAFMALPATAPQRTAA